MPMDMATGMATDMVTDMVMVKIKEIVMANMVHIFIANSIAIRKDKTTTMLTMMKHKLFNHLTIYYLAISSEG